MCVLLYAEQQAWQAFVIISSIMTKVQTDIDESILKIKEGKTEEVVEELVKTKNYISKPLSDINNIINKFETIYGNHT